ncbi:RES family NAD+ phosphorylase [Polaribacter sp. Z014]|uniref:RES family NAD+ phosphorylase n=1 Tax=unclassified Polaribacter TaxID=196858 RepID=UPI00193B530B|nr:MULTISPECIES: RES family NAD+ phosphorylase [unclassified Polaribacter]MCL7763608.1 RES family NAD+ phosphorylase [Polaribacter sp. Z014]QVY65276.1 RES family NAD+ phosphorylase [Polaribacter sp. Q13]
MNIFRLSKRKYATEFNGKGAEKSNNRWNSKGTEIIYTAESRALAMAEVAVHLTIATLPKDYVMITIDVPDAVSIQKIDVKKLIENWNSNPFNSVTKKIGDDFIDAMEACLLKVPSAVVQGDFNYLINPYHKDFKKIKITKIQNFPFDTRIFQ